jgi:hypothetical protein
MQATATPILLRTPHWLLNPIKKTVTTWNGSKSDMFLLFVPKPGRKVESKSDLKNKFHISKHFI